MNKAPCEKCPVMAMCRIKETIVCELLTDFLDSRRGKRKSGSLKKSLNVELLVYNKESGIVSTVRDKRMADDLRNAGKEFLKGVKD